MNPKIVKTQVVKSENVSGASFPTKLTGIQLRKMIMSVFFNKYGFCKYTDRCRKYHESKNCENSSCEIRECLYRHPKTCRFFRDFGFCTFSEWCKFSHKVDRNTTEKNDEVKSLES